MTVIHRAFPESPETLGVSSASKKILYESFLCQWANVGWGEVKDKIKIKKMCIRSVFRMFFLVFLLYKVSL